MHKHDNKSNVRTSQLLAHLLLSISPDATRDERLFFCRLLNELGGQDRVAGTLRRSANKLPSILTSLLALAAQQCKDGAGCFHEHGIAPQCGDAKQKPAKITDIEISDWLNKVLGSGIVDQRLPEIPKLLKQAEAIDPHFWAENLAPHILHQMKDRRRDSIKVLRRMLERALEGGLLSESGQLQVLLDTLLKHDPTLNPVRS